VNFPCTIDFRFPVTSFVLRACSFVSALFSDTVGLWTLLLLWDLRWDNSVNLKRYAISIFRSSLAIGRHIIEEINLYNYKGTADKITFVFWLRDSLLCPYKNFSSAN
jgi:hypothetical protein